jgi:low affinity Fe/Cu permease
MTKLFRRFAEMVAYAAGTPWAFIGALAKLLIWGASGPIFGFSEHWQLIINSFTTIVTFLMVFIIQNTQNRDFKSMQIKLDALLAANEDVPNGLMNLHNLKDAELHRLEQTIESWPASGISTTS